MTESQRNILIVAALAVLGVVFSAQFSVSAWLLQNLMNLAFCFIVTFMAWQWYRPRERAIHTMDLFWRLLLLAAGAALILVIWTGAIYPGWAQGGTMLVVWLAVQGALIYGVHTIFTNRSSSWY
jgi:hypothetical protein